MRFDYVYHLTITNIIMDSTKRRAAEGGPPTFVESIIGDGEVVNIVKTHAYTLEFGA